MTMWIEDCQGSLVRSWSLDSIQVTEEFDIDAEEYVYRVSGSRAVPRQEIWLSPATTNRDVAVAARDALKDGFSRRLIARWEHWGRPFIEEGES